MAARAPGRPKKVEPQPRRKRGTGSIVVTGERAYAQDIRDQAGHRASYEGVGLSLADRKLDAARWLDERVAARARAAGLLPETVAQFLARWLEDTHESGEHGTYVTHRARIRHAAPIGMVLVHEVTEEHVNRVTDAMLEAGRSHRYCRQVRLTLRTAFATLVPKILPSNPVGPYRRKLPIPKRRVKAWDEPPALQFRAVAVRSRWGPLWLLTITYGLRHHELRGLRWTDLSLRRREITVRNRKTHTERVIVLARAVLDQLVAWRDGPASDGWTSAEWMFAMRSGRPIPDTSLDDEFVRLIALANDGAETQLPPLTIHGLRHTAATLMLRRGVPVAKVAEILGHHSPAFTYQMYGWAVPSDEALVDRAISGLLEDDPAGLPGDWQQDGSDHTE